MIKRTPSDFQVEEILSDELRGLSATSGPFALYRLSKESLATPEAIGRAARALNVPSGALAYAGLKDKHASTIQHVTLKYGKDEGKSGGGEGAGEEAVEHSESSPTQLPTLPVSHTASSAPEKASGAGWSIERLGYLPRSITSADIRRNRFRITIRNLSAEECSDMDGAVKLLEVGAASSDIRVVNYFGDQRFGSARHGRGFIARNLIKGDFEGALKLAIATEARKDRMDQKIFKRTVREKWGDWPALLQKLRPCAERKAIERLVNSGGDFRAAFCALPYMLQQLSVYAYQSYLWNAIAHRLVERFCTPNGRVLAVDDPFGEMLFPSSEAVSAEMAQLNLPLLARKTVLAEPWKECAEEVLKEEGIEVFELHIQGVRRPFFGEEPRALFFTAEDFVLTHPQADESAKDKRRRKRTLTFSLPRGSYATVLLRALSQ